MDALGSVQQAAERTGEGPAVFIARAIETQVNRDKSSLKLGIDPVTGDKLNQTDIRPTKEAQIMSNRELAKNLIDQVPESKLLYVVAYLQGIVVPDETPNAATIAAMQELESGGGELWTGSTKDLFAQLDAEDEADA